MYYIERFEKYQIQGMEKGRGRLYPSNRWSLLLRFRLTATAANGVGIDDFEVYDNENPFPVEAKYVAYGGLCRLRSIT